MDGQPKRSLVINGAALGYAYYRQTQLFTCGPACLIMALTLLEKIEKPRTPITELEFWRRANTVYMGEGHPGCGPYGIARLARLHGCDVRILQSHPAHFFKRWNTDPRKRETDLLLERYDRAKAAESGCRTGPYPKDGFTLSELVNKPENNIIISLSGGEKVADGHWICAVPDGKNFTIMDPFIEPHSHQTINIQQMSQDQYYEDIHYLNQRLAIVISDPTFERDVDLVGSWPDYSQQRQQNYALTRRAARPIISERAGMIDGAC